MENDDVIDGEQLFLLVFGFIYLSMIFITYMFQYFNILKNKNVEGISHRTMIIGNISSICTLVNSLIFFFSIFKKCNDIGYINCINSSLGLYQIICQFICYIILYLLFSIYRPSISPNENNNQEIRSILDDVETGYQNKENISIYKRPAVLSFLCSLCFDIILLSITISLLSTNDWNGNIDNNIINFAKAMGIIGSISVVIQYLPQIQRLYINKNPGSVSKITYIFLAIGNIICFSYLISEPYSDVTTWISYLIAFVLQLFIFLQIIYYEKRLKKINSLQEPLLQN